MNTNTNLAEPPAKEPPIKGMTKEIAYGGLPLIEGFFLGCVSATLDTPEALAEFTRQTGHAVPAPRSPIEAAVDKACGHDPYGEFFAKFADWVAEHVWGLAGTEGEIPDDEL